MTKVFTKAQVSHAIPLKLLKITQTRYVRYGVVGRCPEIVHLNATAVNSNLTRTLSLPIGLSMSITQHAKTSIVRKNYKKCYKGKKLTTMKNDHNFTSSPESILLAYIDLLCINFSSNNFGEPQIILTIYLPGDVIRKGLLEPLRL